MTEDPATPPAEAAPEPDATAGAVPESAQPVVGRWSGPAGPAEDVAESARPVVGHWSGQAGPAGAVPESAQPVVGHWSATAGPAGAVPESARPVVGHWSGQAGPPSTSAPASRPLARRLVAPVGVLVGVGAAFAYVGSVDPNEPGHYPVCPLLRFTGIYCPGCGGLRSAHAFVHGELGAALGANALAVVGYGIFAAVMVLWLIRAVRGVPMRLAIAPVWWWGIGAVLAVFTVVRNLPFGSALAP
ncbi:DUF2752 domain-containing protein [Streptomyces sp. NPDC056222]|uniref:DUF2752 domain-containing protein n=1 Tax=Streptomyces sp. NPDC056222 TaxID=3345749 RepID=UPI0035DFABAB